MISAYDLPNDLEEYFSVHASLENSQNENISYNLEPCTLDHFPLIKEESLIKKLIILYVLLIKIKVFMVQY